MRMTRHLAACSAGDFGPCTCNVVQLRDYQSKRAIERAHKELEKSSIGFVAPEKDPA